MLVNFYFLPLLFGSSDPTAQSLLVRVPHKVGFSLNIGLDLLQLRLLHVIAQMRLIFGNSGVGGEAAFGAQNVIKAAECEASRIITQPRPRRGLALRRLSPPIVSRHVAKFADEPQWSGGMVGESVLEDMELEARLREVGEEVAHEAGGR